MGKTLLETGQSKAGGHILRVFQNVHLLYSHKHKFLYPFEREGVKVGVREGPDEQQLTSSGYSRSLSLSTTSILNVTNDHSIPVSPGIYIEAFFLFSDPPSTVYLASRLYVLMKDYYIPMLQVLSEEPGGESDGY